MSRDIARWVRCRRHDLGERIGIVSDDRVLLAAPDTDLDDVLASGHDQMAHIGQLIESAPHDVADVDSVEILAPISCPPSVRDFMSFEHHATAGLALTGRELPDIWFERPCFYFSNPASIRHATAAVEKPTATVAFDYEVEVAIVIGRPGSDIDPRDAGNHIAGMALMCDWSSRDVQAKEQSLGLGPVKSKDSATTLGPWLIPWRDLGPLRSGVGFDIALTASVNDVVTTANNLLTLTWSFEDMVAAASQGTTLRTGDILGSGTVGNGCILEQRNGPDRPDWLREGDEVVVSGGPLGEIRTTIVSAPPSPTIVPIGRRPGSTTRSSQIHPPQTSEGQP